MTNLLYAEMTSEDIPGDYDAILGMSWLGTLSNHAISNGSGAWRTLIRNFLASSAQLMPLVRTRSLSAIPVGSSSSNADTDGQCSRPMRRTMSWKRGSARNGSHSAAELR